MKNDKIFVTRPMLGEYNDYSEILKEVIDSKWITNFGEKHDLLQQSLTKELKVPFFNLMNNGTSALLIALKMLNLPHGSEVITTPFTFAATVHSIVWNGLTPVFCDIEPETMTIDADKIEELITPNTSAILGVHVYGFPCDVRKIQQIAKKYNLKVVYDCAHAFSTEIDGVGIGNFGDATAFSFHATKLFNTIEGGGIASKNSNDFDRIKRYSDFGILDEEHVSEIGINAKMNEIQAAWGLVNLKLYKDEQRKREKVKLLYDNALKNVLGIKRPQMPSNVTNSYQYYPIIIQDDFLLDRDELCNKFSQNNIFVRKYFYPACSDYECYKQVKGVNNLPITNDIKTRVLCLPYYGNLTENDIDRIIECIGG